MLIFAICLLAYLFAGVYYARRQNAKAVYFREQAELSTKRMPRHSARCRSKEWSTQHYKRKYCNCGYYINNDEFPSIPLMIAFWPYGLVESFVTGGTYKPKHSTDEIIKRLERETLGIE